MQGVSASRPVQKVDIKRSPWRNQPAFIFHEIDLHNKYCSNLRIDLGIKKFSCPSNDKWVACSPFQSYDFFWLLSYHILWKPIFQPTSWHEGHPSKKTVVQTIFFYCHLPPAQSHLHKPKPLLHPAILLLGLDPKEMKAHFYANTCTWMFITTWCVINKNWEQLKCLSPGEWINKLWHIHMIEHYSAIKRNKLLLHAI